MARLRVLLADDHPPLLAAIRRLLDPEFEIAGEAADGLEAVRLARTLRPNVVVIDLAMPRMGGIEAIRQIRAENTASAIVVLSVLSDPAVLAAALEAGARGYVLKSQAGIDLIPTIHAAVAGQSRVPTWPKVREWIRKTRRGAQPPSLRSSYRSLPASLPYALSIRIHLRQAVRPLLRASSAWVHLPLRGKAAPRSGGPAATPDRPSNVLASS